MIRVIEEKEVPRKQITCGNCGSVLEYGNADLSIDYEVERDIHAAYLGYYCRPQYFNCPVCGCKVSASWILKKEK